LADLTGLVRYRYRYRSSKIRNGSISDIKCNRLSSGGRADEIFNRALIEVKYDLSPGYSEVVCTIVTYSDVGQQFCFTQPLMSHRIGIKNVENFKMLSWKNIDCLFFYILDRVGVDGWIREMNTKPTSSPSVLRFCMKEYENKSDGYFQDIRDSIFSTGLS
jgi:hypothetical protein